MAQLLTLLRIHRRCTHVLQLGEIIIRVIVFAESRETAIQ